MRRATREALVRTVQSNIQAARRSQASILRASATSDPSDAELPMKIAILDNDISKGDYELSNNIPKDMPESEKTAYCNYWRTYRERNSNLGNHGDKAYLLILIQCTQLLQDKMNKYTACNVTSTSYNPLVLLQLIKKTVFAQAEDQHVLPRLNYQYTVV